MELKNAGVRLPEIDPRESRAMEIISHTVQPWNSPKAPKKNSKFIRIQCKDVQGGYGVSLGLFIDSKEQMAKNKISKFLTQVGVKEGKSLSDISETYGKVIHGRQSVDTATGFINVADLDNE